jgi:1-phosphofructokinase family hexose kinase
MIYTVTLNPCLDRYIDVETLDTDDVNRAVHEARFAGGKGINVSRVIHELGGDTVALGFSGGFSGYELEGRLVNSGITSGFTTIAGDTRTNINIRDLRNGETTRVNAIGPTIQEAELGAFAHAFRRLAPAPAYVVLSGSVPPGVTHGIYAQLARWAQDQGAKVVLDTDGEPLRLGLAARPYMVKPNIHELSRLLDEDLHQAPPQVVASRARALVSAGVSIVVVSLGGSGALAVTDTGAWLAVAPPVPVHVTVGAGDSLVGAFINALSRGQSVAEALRDGVAAGAASVQTSGTELAHRPEVDRLRPLVQIVPLSL